MLAPTVILLVVCVSVTLNAFGATLSTFCILYACVWKPFVPSKYLANTATFSVTLKLAVVPVTFIQLPLVPILYCLV